MTMKKLMILAVSADLALRQRDIVTTSTNRNRPRA
jgi:hypothetical protein